MSKKALIVAGTASMISQFNMVNIEVLQEYGYEIEIACNFFNGNNIDENEKKRFKEELKNKNIKIHQIDFTRNFFNIPQHYKAYKQLKKIKKNNHYDLVHCHMPISALITKFVFRKTWKKGTRVMYTAHGFHFFNGAPLKNWILLYPLEKISSMWLDTLILINTEDYERAKRKMLAKNVYLTPSVGVDINRFHNYKCDIEKVKEELNIPKDAFVLLSVGELIHKKNHMSVLKALHKINNPNIFFIIIGIGADTVLLNNAVKELNLSNNVKFLSYQKDIERIYHISDCLVHVPFREGLGMAPLEAMACSKPLITAYINGIKDYTENEVSGLCVSPFSVDEISLAIERMYRDKDLRDRCSINNFKTVQKYDIANTKKLLQEVYK